MTKCPRFDCVNGYVRQGTRFVACPHCRMLGMVGFVRVHPVPPQPLTTMTVAPKPCEHHTGKIVYRLSKDGRCLGCGKTPARIQAEERAATVRAPTPEPT